MSEDVSRAYQPDCSGNSLEQHQWQPISFRFETQLLDQDGRVIVRQPHTEEGRVYCVCMRCHKHTYIVTSWAGFYVTPPGASPRASAGRITASFPEDFREQLQLVLADLQPLNRVAWGIGEGEIEIPASVVLRTVELLETLRWETGWE